MGLNTLSHVNTGPDFQTVYTRFYESQLDAAGRAVALLRHDDVGNAFFHGGRLLRLAPLVIEHFFAMNEDSASTFCGGSLQSRGSLRCVIFRPHLTGIEQFISQGVTESGLLLGRMAERSCSMS
ncbi:MAG: hypothetical protein ACWGNK_14370 [Desulfobacterales bacterium]